MSMNFFNAVKIFDERHKFLFKQAVKASHGVLVTKRFCGSKCFAKALYFFQSSFPLWSTFTRIRSRERWEDHWISNLRWGMKELRERVRVNKRLLEMLHITDLINLNVQLRSVFHENMRFYISTIWFAVFLVVLLDPLLIICFCLTDVIPRTMTAVLLETSRVN